MDVVRERRLSFWDAMLWATVRQAGCSVIVSENMQHGRRMRGVEVINPFVADGASRLAALLT